MFEAVIVVCLGLAGPPCRDQLVAGYEAPDRAGCENLLGTDPPPVPEGQTPLCKPAGQALPVVEVAEGVFVHQGHIEEPDVVNAGDVANIGFVIGSDSVAVIDTGSARWIGEALWRSIRRRTDLPVSHVILTHMHPDHVFGTEVFVEAGAEVVGHANLSRDLSDRAGNYLESLAREIGADAFLGTRSPEVTVAVGQVLTLDLGGRALELRAWPPAHTGCDLTVLDRRSGTMFAGDLVFDGHIPALDGSLRGWQRVLGELRAMEIARVVPGHGNAALDWPDGSQDLLRYLDVLESDTRAALDRGQRMGDAVRTIAAGEAGHWQLFEAYNARNATVAFTELEWE
ncbi:quinoprotein relay system zinc metallohydrolase 2 [Sulfitobacter sp. LCG007]